MTEWQVLVVRLRDPADQAIVDDIGAAYRVPVVQSVHLNGATVAQNALQRAASDAFDVVLGRLRTRHRKTGRIEILNGAGGQDPIHAYLRRAVLRETSRTLMVDTTQLDRLAWKLIKAVEKEVEDGPPETSGHFPDSVAGLMRYWLKPAQWPSVEALHRRYIAAELTSSAFAQGFIELVRGTLVSLDGDEDEHERFGLSGEWGDPTVMLEENQLSMLIDPEIAPVIDPAEFLEQVKRNHANSAWFRLIQECGLTTVEATAFILCGELGLTYREAALASGVPWTTQKSRMDRALTKLKTVAETLGDDEVLKRLNRPRYRSL